MSKKSRRRNKRLLAMLALAGGAALAGRGKGTAFPRPKEGTIDQMAADAASKAPVTGTEYPGANKAVTPISKNKFRTRHRIIDSAGNTISESPGVKAQILAAKANAPKGIYPPGMIPMHAAGTAHPLAKSRLFRKKGGSVKKAKVTGIAKRGFGRALMKGKR